MTCRDVMTADPKCCLPSDSVAWAAGIMKEEDVGSVPVINDRTEKRLVGIVTDRDITIKVVAAGNEPVSTRVEEVMSKDLTTCGTEDDYEDALDAMARHQVRRIPVVDENGSLTGIISQADVALQSAGYEVAEVVEKISEPSSFSNSFRSMRPRWSGSDREYEPGFGPDTLLIGAACLTAGAGIMYLLDPDRGRSRRAKVRDKAASLYNEFGYYAGKLQRDIRNRATGVVASAKAKLAHEDEVVDQKLEARVRAKLGRVTSHSHPIHVRAEKGCVTLEGPVLAEEMNGIVCAVRSVAGVHEIVNRLQAHEKPVDIPDLQGDAEPRRERWESWQSNWSPTARLVASALGGGLAIYGLRARGPLAKATATVGVGLLARGISNKEVSSWTDLSAARRALGL